MEDLVGDFIMKRYLAVLFASIFALTAYSYGDSAAYEENIKEVTYSDIQSYKSRDINTLIVYFSGVENMDIHNDTDAVSSASVNISKGKIVGDTYIIANYVKEVTYGDLYSIRTAVKYPNDIDKAIDVVNMEQETNLRPKLIDRNDKIDKYDRIILIYPIWQGTIPMPVVSFIENNDLSGKTVIPIATYDRSGAGNSVLDIKLLAQNSVLLEGLNVKSDEILKSKNEVQSFVLNN